jgi:hypothetical protein
MIIMPDMRLIDRGSHTVTKEEMEAKLRETPNEWKKAKLEWWGRRFSALFKILKSTNVRK